MKKIKIPKAVTNAAHEIKVERDFRRRVKEAKLAQKAIDQAVREERRAARLASEQAKRERAQRWRWAERGDTESECEHFAEVGRNLDEFSDRLVIVTKFYGEKEQAEEIAKALDKAGFPRDITIGISTHKQLEGSLDYGLTESADALRLALEQIGFTKVPDYNHVAGMFAAEGNLSASIRSGVKSTLDVNQVIPQKMLHIAIIDSLDSPELGVSGVNTLASGQASLYRGLVPETGFPVNQIIVKGW